MEKLRGVHPASVQIDSKRIAAVVASSDAIWVEHRYDLEDELFPKLLSFLALRLQ